MKVFISWSGELSKGVAELLKRWLPEIIQSVDPWVSSQDIEKGSVWFGELSNAIKEIKFGIVCLTPENLSAPWILFEAGALSRGLDKQRVAPLLIDLNPKDVKPPMATLQLTPASKDEILKLIHAINNNSDKRLDDARVRSSFERCWSEFIKEFDELRKKHPTQKAAPRQTDDILTEILQIVRSMQNTLPKLLEPTLGQATRVTDLNSPWSIPNSILNELVGAKNLSTAPTTPAELSPSSIYTLPGSDPTKKK